MKLKSIHHHLIAWRSALMLAALIPAAHAVDVNGVLDGTDGYTEQALQSITAGWGATNALANLHTVQEGPNLAVFVGGKVKDNAILLFIDSKSGGQNFVPNNLISTGGEEYTINNLGSSSSAGMTFEEGFNPDYAVRIYGNSGETEAYVNRYDLQAGSRSYVGQTVANTVPASGFITEISTTWLNAAPPYNAVVNGVEMKLNLAAMGVPSGSGQPVKLMALLVNSVSSYGSNQVLASRTTSDSIGDGNSGTIGVRNINFQTEAGTQTISLTVDNLDTDGDGDPDLTDPDDDNDGLLDIHETNTGTYVSTTETGSNPLIADTDGDGGSDGNEVLSNHFGFLSNPNIANYASMTIPGSFTSPQWQVDGSAGNAMTRVGTSLNDQNDWTLDFRLTAAGPIEYKFAADGAYTNSWPSGFNNYTATIQATGFHTFAFNNATIVQSLTRKVFADPSAFVAAYDLAGDPTGDADSDNISNEDEFADNTDPTNSDSDGDGLNDLDDLQPLLATRDIVFSVNMTAQEALGNFNPATGTVVVKFFTGVAFGQPDLALTEVGDTGIYSGTLVNVSGPVGAAFGQYKFFNSTPAAPNSGYEEGFDRNFNLGPANTTQTLATVYFSNVNSTYGLWAAANAGSGTASEDSDGDGVDNGVEYFMGETGSSFTSNPQPGAGRLISWPRNPAATDASFTIWLSTDLSNWSNVTANADTSDPNFVKYTIPSNDPTVFVRMSVTVP